MGRQEEGQRARSRREREHKEMLEAALARPGIREVMQVYGEWREKDRVLDACRAAMRDPGRMTTTDSSNPC